MSTTIKAPVPEGVQSYQSRNTRHHWSAEHYRYYVGQQVLWEHGKQDGISYGTRGVVLELPTAERRTLLVKLVDRNEPVEFDGGSGLIPWRKVLEKAVESFTHRANVYRKELKRLDYLGDPIPDA